MSVGWPADLFDGAPVLFQDPVWLWGLLLAPLLVLLLPKGLPWQERARNLASLMVRILGISALILAVSRPEQVRRIPDLSLTLALDSSASMSPARIQDVRALAQRYLDQSGEVPLQIVEPGPRSPAQGSDLSALIAQAAAQAPPARSRRVLLLTDGADTVEQAQGTQALAAAALAGAAGVQLYPLPPGTDGSNAGILELRLPVEVRAKRQVSGVIQVHATAAQSRTLTLMAGEVELGSWSLELVRGTQEIPIEFQAPGRGQYKLELSLNQADSWPQDDTRGGWLIAVGQGPLYVQGVHAQTVADALQAQGLSARAIEALPKSLDREATLLVLGPDVARWRKGEGERLAEFVRQGGNLVLGGGAAGLGSDNPELDSFERALPLTFPDKRKRQPPPLAVVYVVDRSDSMGRERKLSLAVAAVDASVELMSPEARVGVIAFADTSEWIVPLTRARNKDAIVAAVSALSVGGGTEIYGALEEAWLALQATDASLKHIILLTDGRGSSRYEQNSDLIERIARSQITVSTVALSSEAAKDELAKVAAAGGGRAYYTETFADVPRIFVDETLNLLRRNVKEQDTAVRAIPGSRLAGSVDWGTVPTLHGHNPAKPKAAADLGLVLGDRSRPLLASWRHGRGSSTVFASELGGGWTAEWLSWAPHRRWLGELIRAVRERPEPAISSKLSVEAQADQARVWLHAQDAMGAPRGGLKLGVEVLGSSEKSVASFVALVEEVPGLYSALVPWDGALLLQVDLPSARGTPGSTHFAQAAPPLPAELAGRLQDLPLLERLAAASGGVMLPSQAQLLEEGVLEREERREHWPWLILLGVLSVVLDLMIRRVRRPELG